MSALAAYAAGMTRGRIAFATSSLAVALSAVFVSAAFWAPMYNDGSTLVDDNGARVLVPVAVPLVLSLVAFVGLWLKCARGSVAGGRVAIAVLAILAFFTILTGFSIGIFVLPLTALVAVAVVATP
jgi:hypothetical protein